LNLDLGELSFHLRFLARIILLIGFSLFIVDFLPSRLNRLVNASSLKKIIDERISKYNIFLLGTLILLGFNLRYKNLGNLSFWVDELYTTYAAIGLLQNGDPVLPAGTLYDRAILNTYLIALSFKTIGISEFSARIVSVVFGTLTIPLVYKMGTKCANKRVGLLSAILITFSAWEIVWSREARMYAQFQFFYLSAAYLFYLAIHDNLKFLFFSVMAFIGAFYSHILSLTFPLVSVIYVLVYKKDLIKKQYVTFLIPVFLAGALFLVRSSINPLNYFNKYSPLWGQKSIYFYAFSPELRILFLILIVGVLISSLVWKLGIKENFISRYILLNFFIPFLILSAFPWKTHRYALFIFPFLVIGASIIIDIFIIQNVLNENAIKRISKKFGIYPKIVGKLKLGILLFMLILLNTQFFLSLDSFRIPQSTHGYIRSGIMHSNWRKGGDFVKNRMSTSDKIISTLPVAALYYSGQSDYFIRSREQYEILNSEGQFIDRYAGSVILKDYESFITTVSNNSGWIIADYKLDRYYTQSEVRDYILNNMSFHPEASDDTIKVYSW
jgi:uncharacterized membrane protein